MPKLRVLSGKEVRTIFERFGFAQISQRGSHIKLRRLIDGEQQTLTVCLHTEMRRSTLHEIYQQALGYISVDELRKEFYTD